VTLTGAIPAQSKGLVLSFRFPNIGEGFGHKRMPEVVDTRKTNNNCHQSTAGGILALAGKAKRKCRFDHATPYNLVVEG
jgi:hypothetical protein